MTADGSIKVLVVHEDPIVRAGLLAALGRRSDMSALDYGSADRDVDEPQRIFMRPDVIVASYAHAIRYAERTSTEPHGVARPKLVIVMGNDIEWEVRRAIDIGVKGYLLTGCSLETLVTGIKTAHAGGRYFSPGVMERLAESLSAEPLTGREEAVLELVVDGLCNKAIAAKLGVALGTVKTHLKAIFDKLRVESRTQAVIAAARRGLVTRRVDCAGRTRPQVEHCEAVSC